MTPAERDGYRFELAGLAVKAADLSASIQRIAQVLQQEAANDATPTTEPPRMKIKDYAAARALSERTIHEYIAAGMPTHGTGRSRRIDRIAADRWLDGRRPSRG